MDRELKEEYIHALFRFKRMGMNMPQLSDVSMAEIVIMKDIAKTSDCPHHNMSVQDMQSKLHITKSAISQMMSSLEKKGYIEREIDKSDRRKILSTLTPTGENVLKGAKKHADQRLETIISRFGKENTKQLIVLLNKLSDIAEDLTL